MVFQIIEAGIALFYGSFMVLQAFLMVRRDTHAREFAAPVVFFLVPLLVAFLLGGGLKAMYFYAHISFVVVFYIIYRNRILPAVGEESLLFYTILFWAAAPGAWTHTALYAAAIVPTTAVLCACFTRYNIPKAARFLFYVWFLIIIVSLLLPQYYDFKKPLAFDSPIGAFRSVYYLFEALMLAVFLPPLLTHAIGQGGLPATVSLIPLEMTHLYLSVYSLSIFFLLPGRSGLGMWKEHADALADRFSKNQASPKRCAVIIALVGGLLALNAYLGYVDRAALIAVLIVGYGIAEKPRIPKALTAA